MIQKSINTIKTFLCELSKLTLPLAALFGSIAGLSFAPNNSLLLLTIGWAGFFCLLKDSPRKKLLKLIFVFAFSFYFFHLNWIGISFGMVGMKMLIPLISILIPITATAFACLIVPFLKRIDAPLYRIIFFCVAWAIIELIKEYSFLKFPWSLIAYAPPIETLYVLKFIDIRIVSMIIMMLIGLLATPYRIISAPILILWGLSGCFYKMPALGDDLQNHFSKLPIRIIHPGINQTKKWDPEYIPFNLQHQLNLSTPENKQEIIIWPEMALVFSLNKSPELQTHLTENIGKKHVLISGGLYRDDDHIYNSIYALKAGKIISRYDKSILTPFGEYLPLPKWFGFEKLTAGKKDFSFGGGLKAMKIPNMETFLPIICYEAAFPNAIKKAVKRDNAKWLLHLTNDAWFGKSAGPYQHLKIMQVRCVETGLPAIRSANRGISAIIDKNGQLIESRSHEEISVIVFPHKKAPPKFEGA